MGAEFHLSSLKYSNINQTNQIKNCVKFTPWNQRSVVISVFISRRTMHRNRVIQFLNVNWFWSQSKLWRMLNKNFYNGWRAFCAQLVIRCTGVFSGVVIICMTEKQWSVALIENIFDVVRIKKEAVLFPSQIRQRWIWSEMTVQNCLLTKGKEYFWLGVHNLCFICKQSFMTSVAFAANNIKLTLNVEIRMSCFFFPESVLHYSNKGIVNDQQKFTTLIFTFTLHS